MTVAIACCFGVGRTLNHQKTKLVTQDKSLTPQTVSERMGQTQSSCRFCAIRETGLSRNSFPPMQTTQVSSKREQIPIYAAEGTPLGFRSLEAANRLVASGYVKPAYGRKGHLKAVWLLQEDGGNPCLLYTSRCV